MNGTFDPMPIARDRRRFPKFDDNVSSRSARSMSLREIWMHRHVAGPGTGGDERGAGRGVGPGRAARWTPVIFDAIRVKSGDESFVRHEGVYRRWPVPPWLRRSHADRQRVEAGLIGDFSVRR